MGTIAKYTTIRPLGSGPTSDVALCRETTGLGREISLKRLRSDVMSQRSRRDAVIQAYKTWSQLSDEGLVVIFGLDEAEGAVAFEHHPHSGEQAYRSGGLPATDVVEWMTQTFGGLKRLHEGGVLHFNLKPSNLLLTSSSAARLSDGVCIPLHGARELPRPTAKQKYHAPEMIDPELGPIGPGTDIYCLAFLFLELLIGEPFDRLLVGSQSDAVDTQRNWMRWHADGDTSLPSLEEFADRIPAGLAKILDRALVKRVAQRYHHPSELLADLAALRESPPATDEGQAGPRGGPAGGPTGGGKGVRTQSVRTPAPTGPVAKHKRPPISIESIPNKPTAPVVLRCFGCESEMIGVNADRFTIGGADADVTLPEGVMGSEPNRLQFARSAEGWRVSSLDGVGFFVNQSYVENVAPLRSGDAVRLVASGPGFQFTIFHPNAESIGTLASRYAPRLLSAVAKAKSPAAPAAAPAAPTSPAAPTAAPRSQPPTAGPQPNARPTAAPAAPPSAPATAPPSAPANRPLPPGASPAATAAEHSQAASTLQRLTDFKSWDKSTKNWVTVVLGLIVMGAIISMFPAGSGGSNSENGDSNSENTDATSEQTESVEPTGTQPATDTPATNTPPTSEDSPRG